MNILKTLFGQSEDTKRVEQLIKDLKSDILSGRDFGGTASVNAAVELSKIGKPAISYLKNALSISSDAYLALGLMGGEKPFRILYKQLQKGFQSRSPKITLAAARGIGFAGDIRALELLNTIQNDTRDAEIFRECKESIQKIQIKNAKPGEPIPMLAEAEQFWRSGKYDQALSLCEQILPMLDKLDKDKRGWFWFLRGYIIKDKLGQKDPRVREYCIRSLSEGFERVGAWSTIEGNNPLSQKTYFEAMINTVGVDDLKAQLFENVRFSTKPIDWNQNITDSFRIEKPIFFIDENEIINDLATTANIGELNADIKWNLALCLAYGSDKLAIAAAQAIFKVIEKDNNITHLLWMANTMLNTGKLPSGIIWEAGARGLKILLQNCPGKYKDEFCEITNRETGYDISYTYDPDNDESRNVNFVRETKKQGQFNTISTYRVYKAESHKAAFDFLSKSKVDANLLHLVVETSEGNFCRDINGVYRERL